MSKICHNLKKYMKRGLEDRIAQIMGDTNKVKLLSKRDLNSLMNFMEGKKIYSASIMEYIYIKSRYRYEDGIFILNISFFRAVCENGHLEVVKLLLSSEEIVRRFPLIKSGSAFDISLKYACQRGRLEVVKFLLSSEIVERFPKAHIDPSAENNCLVRWASSLGHLDIVKFLLSSEVVNRFPKADINPSAQNNYAIRYASSNNHMEVAKYLLSEEIVNRFPKANIDPCAEDNHIMRQACEKGNLDIMKFLLSDDILRRFPKIKIYSVARYKDLVYSVSCHGHTKMLKFLLSDEIVGKFPSIDPRGYLNDVLEWMVYHNDIEIVKILLRDQRVINETFSQVIHCAKIYSRTEILDLIMSVKIE